jgi:hypothetical protein
VLVLIDMTEELPENNDIDSFSDKRPCTCEGDDACEAKRGTFVISMDELG